MNTKSPKKIFTGNSANVLAGRAISITIHTPWFKRALSALVLILMAVVTFGHSASSGATASAEDPPWGIVIVFSLCALSLLLSSFDDPSSLRADISVAVFLLGGCTILIALASLLSHITSNSSEASMLPSWNEKPGTPISPLGTIPLLTGLCVALIGTVQILARTPTPKPLRQAALCIAGIVITFVGATSLLGYAGISPPSAVSFALLGLGLTLQATRMMPLRWHLGGPAAWGFFIGVILIMIAAQTAYLQTIRLWQTMTFVAHRQEVLTEVRRLHSSLNEMESTQRGYLLTGDESFLLQYSAEETRVRNSLDHLSKLISDNPSQIAHLEALSNQLTTRIATERKLITEKQENRINPASVLFLSQGDSQSKSDFQQTLADMEDTEINLLAADKRAADNAAHIVFVFLPLEIFFCLLALVGGSFFINRGISARASTEETLNNALREEQDLRHALDEHAIVAITDSRGKIIFVNDKFCALSKYSREELLGKDHHIINSGYHPKEFFRTLWATIRQGHVWKGEVKNRAKDGSFYWVETTIVPFLDEEGKPHQYIALRTDITKRKNAEGEIRELNTDLERRVEARTQELISSNKELDSFCYSVSHDLRAPLRGIGGFAKILVEDYAPQLDDTAKDYLHRIQAAADRMSELIDDLLKLSRVSREQINFEDVDLSPIASSIAESLRKTDPEREAEFLITPGLRVQGDPRLLRVMLENLINNAWKFASKKSVTKIEICPISQEDSACTFCIRDNGAGFDMKYAGKLFSPFQRLHGAKEFPGTGIGLATVQRIINRHGGKIWTKSAPNEGASFFFSLTSSSQNGK